MRSGGAFDISKKESRLKEIIALEGQEAFWTDPEKSKKILKEKSQLQSSIDRYQKTQSSLSDLEVLIELLEEDSSDAHLPDANKELDKATQHVHELELSELLSGRNDKSNAIVSINAGAGGTEAQDWAQMLLRMYLRYCEAKGFRTQIVDQQAGEEAGLKSVTFTVEGDYSYGFLSAEIGVHRLVRVSPFDANHRRHTSFASVFVYPDIEEEVEIEILDKDIRVDTYRAGGAGGQHVNKTDSAVRITHFPTGIVVQCQNERSQHQNRALAMKVLKARIFEAEQEKKRSEQQALEDSKMQIAWGSQIRSYTLQPYRLIKDHRTDYEMGDVLSVLDGNVQPFIEKFLLMKGKKR